MALNTIEDDEVHDPAKIVTGNYFDKYQSRNPIHRDMVDGFLRAAQDLVQHVAPARVIEVGCGSGDLAARLFGPSTSEADSNIEYVGIDIGDREIELARECYPQFDFRVASAYELPFPADSADLVIACEVFEHLDRLERALEEVERVCRGSLLISVPWEPTWRILNMARGKHLRQFGNTPGHVQHFSRASIRKLVNSRFEIVEMRKPFPWTMFLANKRGE